MRMPSRVTPYKNSTLARFPMILRELEKWDMHPSMLYGMVRGRGLGIDEFMEALDCLFLLGAIEYIPEKEVLHYVKGNRL